MVLSTEEELRYLELKKSLNPQEKKEEAPKAEPEPEPEPKPESEPKSHKHTLDMEEKGIFCKDCKKPLVDPTHPEAIDISDALDCPTCSDAIFKSLTAKIGDYEDKGGDIVIHRNRGQKKTTVPGRL
jgi:DNA-directed RNA polymerase subunit RPC12/RpoP